MSGSKKFIDYKAGIAITYSVDTDDCVSVTSATYVATGQPVPYKEYWRSGIIHAAKRHANMYSVGVGSSTERDEDSYAPRCYDK